MKTKIFMLVVVVLCSLTQVNASFPVKSKQESTVLSNQNVANSVTIDQNQEVVKSASTTKMESADDLMSPAGGGKSQLIALILVIFVGGLGIHRFYLGYTTIGIIQLLTLGGCGIWALIDLVRIATGDLKPKGGDYTEKL